jgi:hypothetical protein
MAEEAIHVTFLSEADSKTGYRSVEVVKQLGHLGSFSYFVMLCMVKHNGIGFSSKAYKGYA